MTAKAVLNHLRSLGVRVSVEGDRLRIDAPAGVLTPEVKAVIAENRAELIRLLQGNMSPVVLGPNGEDPLDYRHDPLTGEWVYERDWWRRSLLN
jgi:hypothetical protein